MDLPWGSEFSKKFITNVGLITSDGPFGPNIMSCEWTHHLSYSPGLIGVTLKPTEATFENIRKTKEFAVSIAASDQAKIVSVAGNNTGKAVHKIKLLEELGAKFLKAQKIKVLLVDGAALQVECKLVQEIPVGDHTLFIGEVLAANFNPAKQPLAFHQSQFGTINLNIAKPESAERERIQKIVEKHKK